MKVCLVAGGLIIPTEETMTLEEAKENFVSTRWDVWEDGGVIYRKVKKLPERKEMRGVGINGCYY